MQLVTVKDIDGHEGTFALISHTESAAFVCRVEAYASIMSGERPMPIVGFPIEDVWLTEPRMPLLDWQPEPDRPAGHKNGPAP